jgi:mannose/cellobiose epimerase-like protein (N-acyl-D-glucosamine 2-epimerase family)
MDEAAYRGDEGLFKTACSIFRLAIEAGWDEEFGGILYFIDAKGLPTEAYEHDMKLWWPHNEILIASVMLYRDTGEEKYLDTWSGSTRCWSTARTISPMRNTANGTDTCAATASPPLPPPRAPRSRDRSMSRGRCAWQSRR